MTTKRNNTTKRNSAEKRPEPKPMTDEERVEFALGCLKREVERFEATKAETLAKLMDEPTYYLGWLNDFAITAARVHEIKAFLYTVEHAQNFTKQDGTPLTVQDIAIDMHKDWTRRLLNNQYRATSTSSFHNANEEATREAVSRLVRDLTLSELLPKEMRTH